MITRLYANNYRCLVAFETKFDSFGVLCGPNGAGKSSVFDALGALRNLASASVTAEQRNRAAQARPIRRRLQERYSPRR